MGLVGGAALTGLVAVGNAKREIDGVIEGKTQKKIEKKCANADKQEVWDLFSNLIVRQKNLKSSTRCESQKG